MGMISSGISLQESGDRLWFPLFVFQFAVVQSEEKFGWTGLEMPGLLGPPALLPSWGEGLRADKA